MFDLNGYMIHIDFGFILGISPGGIGFEGAPFKLTHVRLFINFSIGIYANNGWS